MLNCRLPLRLSDIVVHDGLPMPVMDDVMRPLHVEAGEAITHAERDSLASWHVIGHSPNHTAIWLVPRRKDLRLGGAASDADDAGKTYKLHLVPRAPVDDVPDAEAQVADAHVRSLHDVCRPFVIMRSSF